MGGVFSNTSRSTTITFKKEFVDTSYYANVCINHYDGGWTASVVGNVGSKTTTSMIAGTYFTNSNTSGINSWCCMGYVV